MPCLHIDIRFRGAGRFKFFGDAIWNLLQVGLLPNNENNFFRQMINYMRAWNYIQKTSGSLLNTQDNDGQVKASG